MRVCPFILPFGREFMQNYNYDFIYELNHSIAYTGWVFDSNVYFERRFLRWKEPFFHHFFQLGLDEKM